MIRIGARHSRIIELYKRRDFSTLIEYTGVDIAGFVDDYKHGYTFKHLSRKYSIGVVSAWRILKKLGIYEYRMGRNQNEISGDVKLLLDNENFLRKEFEVCTIVKIAKKLGVCNDTLRDAFRKFNIPVVNSEFKKCGNVSAVKFLNKDYLYRQYIKSGKTAQQIANEIGTSQSTVLKYLKEFEIKRRQNGKWQYADRESTFRMLNSKNFLYDEYVNKKKSAYQIALDIDSVDTIVLRKLQSFGIERRSSLEYANSRSSLHDHRLIPLLEEKNVKHITSHIIKMSSSKNWAYEIDEYLPDHKIFLELQGTYWHGYGNLNKTIAKNVYGDIKKWRILTKRFPDHKIVYILESDFSDGLAEKIIDGIINEKKRKRKKWNSSKYVFEKSTSSSVRDFVGENHYLRNVPANKYVFCVRVGGKIVAVAIFSQPSRNEQRKKYGKNVIELSRYCSSEHGTNLNSWFLSKCINQIEERPIITYADITRYPGKLSHSGTMYKAANFKYLRMTETNYRYLNANGRLLHKRAIWQRAKKNNVTESTQAKSENLTKFPEWPKNVFIYG